MLTHIALLRGVNVGGKVMVPMAELRGLIEGAGFSEVKTLLQSGNVVFEGEAGDTAALERKLEAVAAKKFGRAIDFFVRDAAAWRKIVADNPFVEEARRDPSRLLVLCLKAAPGKEALAALKAAVVGPEIFRAGERCLYIYYSDGIGRSKLTSAVFDRKLGLSSTARNWNTVLKLAAMLEDQPPA